MVPFVTALADEPATQPVTRTGATMTTRPEETHRVVWQHAYIRDPRTGQVRLAYVWPRYLPRQVTSWKDRFGAPYGIFDLAILAGALVLIVLSVVTR